MNGNGREQCEQKYNCLLSLRPISSNWRSHKMPIDSFTFHCGRLSYRLEKKWTKKLVPFTHINVDRDTRSNFGGKRSRDTIQFENGSSCSDLSPLKSSDQVRNALSEAQCFHLVHAFPQDGADNPIELDRCDTQIHDKSTTLFNSPLSRSLIRNTHVNRFE